MGGFRGQDDVDAQEASSLLEPEDVLEDDGYGDVLDRGYSPRDTAVVGEDYADGLDQRLARELPDRATDDEGDEIGDLAGGAGEPRDDEVGAERAGRLSADDDGYGDSEEELWAEDEGVDGAAASAEEAAVHVIGNDA